MLRAKALFANPGGAAERVPQPQHRCRVDHTVRVFQCANHGVWRGASNENNLAPFESLMLGNPDNVP